MYPTILSHIRATPGGQPKNINPTYSPEIGGWDFSWLELLVARLPPSSNHSSSSSQLKSQPYISGEYVGLMFLVTGATGFLVWPLYHPIHPHYRACITPPPLIIIIPERPEVLTSGKSSIHPSGRAGNSSIHAWASEGLGRSSVVSLLGAWKEQEIVRSRTGGSSAPSIATGERNG